MIELIFKSYTRQFIYTTLFSCSSLVNFDELENIPNNLVSPNFQTKKLYVTIDTYRKMSSVTARFEVVLYCIVSNFNKKLL